MRRFAGDHYAPSRVVPTSDPGDRSAIENGNRTTLPEKLSEQGSMSQEAPASWRVLSAKWIRDAVHRRQELPKRTRVSVKLFGDPIVPCRADGGRPCFLGSCPPIAPCCEGFATTSGPNKPGQRQKLPPIP